MSIENNTRLIGTIFPKKIEELEQLTFAPEQMAKFLLTRLASYGRKSFKIIPVATIFPFPVAGHRLCGLNFRF